MIYPELHYGRDALVGTALFLTWLAKKGMTMTRLRATYPSYYASKNKIELTPAIDVDKVLREVKGRYSGENVNDIDGVKIDFAENWGHLRKSNTDHPRLHRGEVDGRGRRAGAAVHCRNQGDLQHLRA